MDKKGVRRAAGPFVFFDHFGPVTVGPGNAQDLRPHPHIGLATVSYLYEGAMLVNKDDPHAVKVFDASIKGETDRFVYRFDKP